MTGPRRVLLLPERRRFRGQRLSAAAGRLLGRADSLPVAEPGERAQLRRHFHVQPAGWPMAALLRQQAAADSAGSCWLRADPAFVRAEMMGARLMAWSTLGISEDEADDLMAPLLPVFAESGFELSRTAPEQWYLRLPAETQIPEFSPPADALGGQLLAHLPEGEGGRRWRQLGNEAQILLHNHPLNARRASHGLAPVNTLWFWGGGRLPERVLAGCNTVLGADEELAALAAAAGVGTRPTDSGDVLVDLRREREWGKVETVLLEDAASMSRRHGDVHLDFADGSGFRLTRAQAWRWLRPALRTLEPE